jgi:hypothetical protein
MENPKLYGKPETLWKTRNFMENPKLYGNPKLYEKSKTL